MLGVKWRPRSNQAAPSPGDLGQGCRDVLVQAERSLRSPVDLSRPLPTLYGMAVLNHRILHQISRSPDFNHWVKSRPRRRTPSGNGNFGEDVEEGRNRKAGRLTL